MPLRVKCRCGQELVLRFSEWIYALFGLLVISLLVNGTALVYIAIKLGSLKGQMEEVRPAAPEAAWKDAPEKPAQPSPSPPPPAPEIVPGPLSPPEPGLPVAAPAPIPPPEKSSPRIPAEVNAAAPAGTPEVSPGDGKSREGPPTERSTAAVSAPERPRQDLLSEGTIPLERLLIVEKCDDPRLLLAFLADGDGYVRRAALKKSLSAPAPAGPPPHRDLLLVALPSASGILSLSGGGDLLRRLAGGDHGPDPSSWWAWGRTALGIDPAQGPPGEVWLPLATRAQVLRESSAATQAIERSWKLKDGKAASGTDVLIAIDTTESMEEPFSSLVQCGWIFPALAWSIPDLRAGLLFYDDEVKESSLPLGTDPRELERSLSCLKAEGGGDVPEGVHEALKAALQLGRFDWRSGAAKHIIFVGDGPPPRSEVPALLSLAKECHQDGGYQIHAISVNPTEGRTATLHFPELAAAGGGRAVTAPNDRIGSEIFLTLFPAEARDELGRLLPMVLPSPERDPPRSQASVSPRSGKGD